MHCFDSEQIQHEVTASIIIVSSLNRKKEKGQQSPRALLNPVPPQCPAGRAGGRSVQGPLSTAAWCACTQKGLPVCRPAAPCSRLVDYPGKERSWPTPMNGQQWKTSAAVCWQTGRPTPHLVSSPQAAFLPLPWLALAGATGPENAGSFGSR